MKYLFSFCSWSNLWVKTNLHTKGFEFLTKIKTYRIITVLTFPKYAYVRNWPYGWIGPCKNFFFLENSCTHMGLSYMPVWRCLVTGQKLKTPLWKSLGVKDDDVCCPAHSSFWVQKVHSTFSPKIMGFEYKGCYPNAF